jgi:hypothetical protein
LTKSSKNIILKSIVKQEEVVISLSADLTTFIETTDEAIDLAMEYISEKVFGQTSYADCLYRALATIHRADFLVSWNLKHHWKYVTKRNLCVKSVTN